MPKILTLYFFGIVFLISLVSQVFLENTGTNVKPSPAQSKPSPKVLFDSLCNFAYDIRYQNGLVLKFHKRLANLKMVEMPYKALLLVPL